MKITLVTHSMYPESIGGREKYVYYLADSLGKRGHKVKVFTCTPALHSRVRKYENFTVHYFPSIDIPLKNAKYRIPVMMALKLLQDDADIIHAQDLHHFTTFASSLAAAITKRKVIVTEHGYPPLGGLMKLLIEIYDKTCLKFIGKSSSKIIAVSNFISKELERRYKLDRAKSITIHNGMYNMQTAATDADAFVEKYALKNKKIILGIGRQTKEKGFQYLIRAFKKISGKFPNIVLVIVGPPGGYRIVLEGLVRKFGLAKRVIFTGPLDEELVRSAMKKCEMVVIPSEYEPFPFVALESLSFGKPVVAAAVGGLPEIFTNGSNGLLFMPEDEKDLAEKMQLLLKNREVKNKLIRNSRESLKRFNWDSFIEKIESVYEKVAAS